MTSTQGYTVEGSSLTFPSATDAVKFVLFSYVKGIPLGYTKPRSISSTTPGQVILTVEDQKEIWIVMQEPLNALLTNLAVEPMEVNKFVELLCPMLDIAVLQMVEKEPKAHEVKGSMWASPAILIPVGLLIGIGIALASCTR